MAKPTDQRSTYYFIDILSESIVTTFDGGWVSLNSYNAQCLNLERIWIADIDFEDVVTDARRDWRQNYSKEDIATLSRFTFGVSEEVQSLNDNLRQELVSMSAKNAVAGLDNGNYRLYETCGGIRIIRIDKPLEPRSNESVRNHLWSGTDQRYQELCLYQNCYRARITPKPWRKSIEPIRVTRHIGDCQVRDRENRWEKTGITQWEKLTPNPDLVKLIEYHDDKTLAFSTIQLIG